MVDGSRIRHEFPITLGRLEGRHRRRWKPLTADYLLDFVLSDYVSEGVEELAMEKLTPLLRMKYHDAIADAVADLGPAKEIRSLSTGFLRFLYEDPAGEASHAA